MKVGFKQQDLTQGSIAPLLFKFAVPYMLSSLMQALYGAVDMIVVGQFTNVAGLSAVSIGSQFMFLIMHLIMGLSMGATIMIGRYFGAHDEQGIDETLGTMFSSFAIISVVATVVMFAAIDPVIALLQTPPEAVEQTRSYILISVLGIIFMFAYNALSAMLRGFGDSKSPMIFVGIACVCNIFGDLLLVAVFHMGAGGAALATIASQGLSALLAVIYLKRQNFRFKFHKLSNYRIHWGKLKSLFLLGAPMAIQGVLTTVSFMFITATVNVMGGVVASAAIGVMGKLNGFTMLPPISFSAAISAMVAQNMGAHELRRSLKCMYTGVAASLAFGVPCFIFLQFFPHAAITVFTKDAALIRAGTLYLHSFSIDCMLVCVVFCLNGFFNGCGHTPFSMFNNVLAAFLIRVPATWLFSRLPHATLFHIGFAAPCASIASIFIGLLYLKKGKWQKSNILGGNLQ